MDNRQHEFNWYKPELGAASNPSGLNIEVPRTPQQQRFQLRLQRNENPLQDPSSRRKKYAHVAEKILSDSERIVSRSKKQGSKTSEKRKSSWGFLFSSDNDESDLQHYTYLKSSQCRRLCKISIAVLAIVGLTMNMAQLDLLLNKEHDKGPNKFVGVSSRETLKTEHSFFGSHHDEAPSHPSPLDFQYNDKSQGNPTNEDFSHPSPEKFHQVDILHENDKHGGYMTETGQVIKELLPDIEPLVPQLIDQDEGLVVSDEVDPSTVMEPNEESKHQSESDSTQSEIVPELETRDNIDPNQSQSPPTIEYDPNQSQSPPTIEYDEPENTADISTSPKQIMEYDGFFDEFPIFDQAPIEDVPIQFDSELPRDEFTDLSNEPLSVPTSLSQVSLPGLVGLPKVDSDGSIHLEELGNFKDTAEPWDSKEVPIFLHIPKAGGSTVKDIMGTCHRFVMATETGILDGHVDDPEITIVYPGGGPAGQDRSPFVNVDTTTVEGISRAREMGFADSGLADAVVTPFIFEANDLVTPTAKGRLFTIFRHPIERAISMFYYLQIADWEPTYDPELKFWTFEQYAQSSKVENNWLTRQLSNQPFDDLGERNLDIAMEVIRQKFIVGLVTEIEATMDRFEKVFRWKYHVNPTTQEQCRQNLLSKGSNANTEKSGKPKEGSEEWKLLEQQNEYDLRLYAYIEELFQEQRKLVADIPDDFRNVDATCCKCGPPTFPPEGFSCPMSILN